jgi:hypothetical protein
LALLALLAGQDVEWVGDGTGGVVWRIARKVRCSGVARLR